MLPGSGAFCGGIPLPVPPNHLLSLGVCVYVRFWGEWRFPGPVETEYFLGQPIVVAGSPLLVPSGGWFLSVGEQGLRFGGTESLLKQDPPRQCHFTPTSALGGGGKTQVQGIKRLPVWVMVVTVADWSTVVRPQRGSL